MKTLDRLTPIALLASVLLTACDDPSGPPDRLTQLPRELTATERELITASNSFAFGMLREVNGDENGKNVFISPLSASLALGMTMNGARGQTLDAMRSTLGFGDTPLGEVNAGYLSLIELLRGLDRRVDMRIANSVWYRTGFPVEQTFIDVASTYFDAEVSPLDFASPNARKTINSWVDESTNGRIRELIGDIPPEAVMYLINAIYFKGSWTNGFDRNDTRDDTFTAEDGARVPVKMMSVESTFALGGGTDYRAVDLPYGNGAFSMTILLPNEGKDVDDILMRLDADEWDTLVNGLHPSSITIMLPRFRLDYEKGLNDALEALGMGIAFTESSDFTGISREDPLISRVFQKTFVEVNEEGTEAAAATAVEVQSTSAGPTLRMDRPFIFAIREHLTGTILFVGKVAKP